MSVNWGGRWVAMVALVAALAPACRPSVSPMPISSYTGSGVKVAVIGDSITNYSTTEIRSALAPYRHSVTGIPGIGFVGALDRLVRPAVASKPDVLIIELGINSAREVWNSADLKWLEATLKELDKVPRVIWITPSALTPSYYDHLGAGTIAQRIAAFKASLVKRLPKHPNQRLADFSVSQLTHPEWFDVDHLHPSPAGKTAIAAYMLARLVDAP